MLSKTLSHTITGELHLPIRLYYQIQRKSELENVFNKMNCMEFDEANNRWIWLYKSEAKRLPLPTLYRKSKKELRPIIIGSLFFKPNGYLAFDLRSFERAIQAITFFDQRISRDLFKVQSASVYNRLSQTSEDKGFCFDSLFSEHSPQDQMEKFEKNMEKVFEKLSSNKDGELLKHLESTRKSPLPPVEFIPIHFYEDGIEMLETTLKFRQVAAIRIFNGEPNITLERLLQNSISG